MRIFRVDNPHTKPIPFWAWVIAEVQAVHPDVIFLAEAFTRPKVMQALAKVGFTQSYTYFTWRNFKQELIDYLTELTHGGDGGVLPREPLRRTRRTSCRPSSSRAGRPAFQMRLVLAATLSSVYGIYSGYELCENAAIPGTEEYLDSEKYEIKVRDWNAPGNIQRVRRAHQPRSAARTRRSTSTGTSRFYESDDEHVLCYGKRSADGGNAVLVAVNLDPFDAARGAGARAARGPGHRAGRALPGPRADHGRAAALAGAGAAHPPRPAARSRRRSSASSASRQRDYGTPCY